MFLTSDEQEDFRQAVRQMCEDKVAPGAAECDEKAQYPWHAHEAFSAMGLMGLTFPEDCGGSGADHVTWAICIEEIARVDASASLIPAICDLAMTPVMRYGSKEIQQRFLTPICEGRAQASYCLSEAEAGSDVASMTTKAVRDGDEWVINGRKQWITNAGISDFYTVFAKTDRSAGHRGISAFVVEKDTPGFSIGKLEHKLGIRASPTGEVILEDVRVPAENMIGEEGKGFYYAMGTFDWSRPVIGAQAVGIAQGALDYAANYMNERRTFGQPLTSYQGLQFMVADMAMEIEAARGPRLPGGGHGRHQPSRPHPDGVDGQVLRRRRGHEGDHRRRPAPRRLRLHQGLPRRADVPRRQDHPDLRGHQPDPADGHRP